MLGQALITLAVGCGCGLLLRRLNVPAGGMVGAFGAVAALTVATGGAATGLPTETRIVVQVLAGAFVGCSLDRDDLRNVRRLLGPIGLMIGWYLAFVLVLGFALAAVADLSLPTALMSCVPGGISDVPIVAAAMGADSAQVTLLQLMRLLLGIGLLPLIIGAAAKQGKGKHGKQHAADASRPDETLPAASGASTSNPADPTTFSAVPLSSSATPHSPFVIPSTAEGSPDHFPLPDPADGVRPGLVPEMEPDDFPLPEDKPRRRERAAMTAVTIIVAATAGLLGQVTAIPGMTFTFTIAAVLALRLGSGFAYVPRWMKRLCQFVAGSYLGAQVTAAQVLGLGTLVVPALIVAAAYTAGCFALGHLQSRLFGYTATEGRLIATPAGASDMALIMEDLGVKVNSDVIIIQIVRLIVVLGLFPQVVNVVLHIVGV